MLEFGTSGLRGLASELTDRECWLFARSFAELLAAKGAPREVGLGGDRRESTPRILRAVAAGLRAGGAGVENWGIIPTPALAHWALARGQGAVMVTGSHIPAERNGLKFYLPWGEILKEDEARLAALAHGRRAAPGVEERELFQGAGGFRLPGPPALPAAGAGPARAYVGRYLDFCPPGALAGRRLVLYQHSAAGAPLLAELFAGLGAVVLPAGASAGFVAVDTEAVEDQATLARWVAENRADALVSTDGDGDRPLLVDERGRLVRGDALGLVAAAWLGIEALAVPVSVTSVVERCGRFARVRRTRIGSPYVIYALLEFLDAGLAPAAGFEANGGFLLATGVARPDGRRLAALPTRDAVLPLVCALLAAGAGPVSAAFAWLPARGAASGRLRDFPRAEGLNLIARLQEAGAARQAELFAAFGRLQEADFTDGARFSFAGGEVLHLRPSGNAPEFRVYTEAAGQEEAEALNERGLRLAAGPLRAWAAGGGE